MLIARTHIMAIARLEQFDIATKLAIDIEQQVKYIKLAMNRSEQVANTITHILEPTTQLKVLPEQELVLVFRQVGIVECIKFGLAGKLIKQSNMMAD